VSSNDALEAVDSIDGLRRLLEEQGYLADEGLASAVYLAIKMERPLLLEGEVGVGKTELSRVIAQALGRELIRLQCYEGIDANQALYEWDYARQLLYARAVQEGQAEGEDRLAELYSIKFLSERPLLRAARTGSKAVLLIDEIDRSDDEFEAFLLEFLSDYTVSIPEIGTVTPDGVPIVVLTSNRTREIHAALNRRCLYHWMELPDVERETEIILIHVPEASKELARSVARAVARARQMDLVRPPGAAEAIDWCRALALLGASALEDNPDLARQSIGWVAKNRDDVQRLNRQLAELLESVRAAEQDEDPVSDTHRGEPRGGSG
jgi:MoxR-like ATPase